MKVTPGGSLWHDRFQLQHCCIILQNLKKGPVVHGGHAEKTSDPGQDDAVFAFQVIDSALCLLQALKTWHPCFLPISSRNLTVNRPWASKRFFHTLAKEAQGGQRNRKVSFYSNTGKKSKTFYTARMTKTEPRAPGAGIDFSVLLVLQISKQTWNFNMYIYISLSLSQHAYYIVIMIGCCLLLRPLLRTVCSETAAAARWSRYLAEQHKIKSCYIYTEKATSSWSLSVSEVTAVRSKITTHQSERSSANEGGTWH